MNGKSRKPDIGSLKHQYFAAATANIIFLSAGSMLGWTAGAISVLQSKDSPLNDGPLTNEQISWIGSIMALSAIVGTFLFGLLTTWLGCKRTMLSIAAPAISSWVLIYFGNTYYHILVARILAGLTMGGSQATVVLFVAEIANNNIRGRLSSFSAISRNVTILLAFVLSILPYKVTPCIFVLLPITFGILFFILPNTPQYYLANGNIKEANKSLKFYEGYKTKNVEESVALMAELERMQLIASNSKNDEKTTIKDIFTRKALKGILIAITLASLEQSTGISVFVMYPVAIFKQAGASQILSPYNSSILLAIVKIVAALCTSKLCDSLGRKALLICSFVGSAFGLFSFALYAYLSKNGYDLSAFGWVPLMCVLCVVFFASSGVIPLFPLCTVEVLPQEARTIGLTIGSVFLNITAFCTLKVYPIWSEQFGLDFCMVIFGIACIFGTFFVYFIIEETKGKALDAIHSKEYELAEKRLSLC